MIKDYRQLMLLSKRGLSIRQIARMAGCKWETARDALERMKTAYGSLEAIPQEATSDDIRGMIRSMQETHVLKRGLVVLIAWNIQPYDTCDREGCGQGQTVLPRWLHEAAALQQPSGGRRVPHRAWPQVLHDCDRRRHWRAPVSREG